jgi:hypothetical protein
MQRNKRLALIPMRRVADFRAMVALQVLEALAMVGILVAMALPEKCPGVLAALAWLVMVAAAWPVYRDRVLVALAVVVGERQDLAVQWARLLPALAMSIRLPRPLVSHSRLKVHRWRLPAYSPHQYALRVMRRLVLMGRRRSSGIRCRVQIIRPPGQILAEP